MDSNSDLRVRAGTALGLDGEENRFGAGDFPRALGHPRLAVEPIQRRHYSFLKYGGFSTGSWPPLPCMQWNYKDHNTVNMADFLRALDHPRLQRNLQRRQYSNNDDITVKMADFLWALGTPASQ